MADPAAPQPIPPLADNVGQEEILANINAMIARIGKLVGLPLGISLDGQSLQFGSANEGTIAAERILKLLTEQLELEARRRPFFRSQVYRG